MINIPVWMFLSSYEKMRNIMLHNNTIVNLVHPGTGNFSDQICAQHHLLCLKTHIKNYVGRYHRLFDSQGEVHSVEERKETHFYTGKGLHTIQQEDFFYDSWNANSLLVTSSNIEMYGNYKTMAEIATPKVGMQTSNNDRYLRL